MGGGCLIIISQPSRPARQKFPKSHLDSQPRQLLISHPLQYPVIPFLYKMYRYHNSEPPNINQDTLAEWLRRQTRIFLSRIAGSYSISVSFVSVARHHLLSELYEFELIIIIRVQILQVSFYDFFFFFLELGVALYTMGGRERVAYLGFDGFFVPGMGADGESVPSRNF